MNSRLRSRSICLFTAVAALVLTTGCTTAPRTSEERAQLISNAEATIAKARQADPDFAKFLDSAAGFVVFPKIAKGAAGVGGAYGKGVLFLRGQAVGFTTMTQATVGAQLGGQGYAEIIAFETPEAVKNFERGNFTFAAQASAVALKSGASKNAKYTDGVAVFSFDETGLMAEAAIGGQKFDYEPKEQAK
jgi:lipid-binding SYLF domain-containing protein